MTAHKEMYVYICGRARKPDLFKVGFTIAPRRRLSQLKGSTGDRTLVFHYIATAPYGIPADLIERQVHNTLQPHRAWGEWFWLPLATIRSTLINAIRQVTKADPGMLPNMPHRKDRERLAYHEARDNWRDMGGGR